ncbi:MAG: hypothetical protein EWV81_03355 [Microcystis aeruginosa Ma_SC_T_19800800_S464]|uniref:Uncharacterized protein n=1 Tax=Microcystis aeruginosa Ma_SC_T_19800800_S464 TaxID=2486257 RepID=A0A552E3P3_MICAE|nr:MAG: hypothetical protein EWV81_03355 [Microcystis aeruginosa Ma_SC_T_19800800_S464]
MLPQQEPDKVLYLAIPEDTYDDFFSRQFIQDAVAEHIAVILMVKYKVFVFWSRLSMPNPLILHLYDKHC